MIQYESNDFDKKIEEFISKPELLKKYINSCLMDLKSLIWLKDNQYNKDCSNFDYFYNFYNYIIRKDILWKNILLLFRSKTNGNVIIDNDRLDPNVMENIESIVTDSYQTLSKFIRYDIVSSNSVINSVINIPIEYQNIENFLYSLKDYIFKKYNYNTFNIPCDISNILNNLDLELIFLSGLYIKNNTDFTLTK